MKSLFPVFLLISFFGFFLTVNAQVPNSVGGLELTPSTNSPAPGQKVTITARSYTIDINSAKLSWYVNGKLVQSGNGQTTFETTAPALGKKLSVDVTASNTDGIVVKSTITLGSGSVDIIYETDGYVPPLFKGKVEPVYQNALKIVAVPHLANSAGVEYDPKTLVYQWKKSGRAVEDQSGYGKQSIVIVGDVVPRTYDISVSVWPRDNSSSASASAQVGMGAPEIKFYEDDPLYGTLFNRSIGPILRIGNNKEVGVLAVPFGFNRPRTGTGDLSWSWGLNNLDRTGLSNKESIILRAPDSSSGASTVSLNIVNSDKILQGASSAFSVLFNASKSQEGTVTF